MIIENPHLLDNSIFKWVLLISFCLATSIGMSGCASLAGDRLVSVNKREIEISEIDHSPPPVIFETGLNGYKEIWNKVFPVIASEATVFAYDRPGVGRSDTTSKPRNGMVIVEELRQVLRAQNLAPPYILVGHSSGGLYMQLYARHYPAEVAGLVLVEPTHPAQFEGDGALQNRPFLARTVMWLMLTGRTKKEFEALGETGREVLAAPPLPTTIPIIILTAPNSDNSTIAHVDNAKRADFARLYPSARMIQVKSGHAVQQDKPEAVIAAIRDVLVQVRASNSRKL
jgi:pimeloyl-ACP methyl ester carboxylesterase